MKQTCYYKVAGFPFSVALEDKDRLWRALSCFEPFRVTSIGIPLFAIEWMENRNTQERSLIIDNVGENREKLYATNDGVILEVTSIETDSTFYFQLKISKDFKKGEIYSCKQDLWENRRSALIFSIRYLFYLNTVLSDSICVHASCVIKDGKAVLFHAKSGTGKSTHSQQWMKAFPDAELLDDDYTIVRVWPDGQAIAYGSPWSGKTPCYKNLSAPVAAFVRINRANENKIHRLNPVQAYASLMPSCTGQVKWNKEIVEALHQTLSKIVATVPCYQLDCLPNEDAARECAAEVLNKEEYEDYF